MAPSFLKDNKFLTDLILTKLFARKNWNLAKITGYTVYMCTVSTLNYNVIVSKHKFITLHLLTYHWEQVNEKVSILSNYQIRLNCNFLELAKCFGWLYEMKYVINQLHVIALTQLPFSRGRIQNQVSTQTVLSLYWLPVN